MAVLIQPKVLKGFRDALPAAEIERSALLEKITAVYRSFGFVPIDTPALEYSDILLRKSDGETEKQVFRFSDNGGRDIALRFDLTVPFARFVAEHRHELYFPFKRYHIAKVWRGEKPQAGRYREFLQCDIDIVGSESAAADFEILTVMRTALAAVGATDISIHINNRATFNRFLEKHALRDKGEHILRTVDKLQKLGTEAVEAELAAVTGDARTAAEIVRYSTAQGSFDETLAHIEQLAGGPAADTERLRVIHAMMEATGTASTYTLDPSITRGLDYYTGIVYETFLNAAPSLGSVCSGGRYDNLTGLYMNEKIPGVGASIGIDRLLAGRDALGMTSDRTSYLDAEIFCLNTDDASLYEKTAAQLRAQGIAVEVFPDAKKMQQQYAVTDAKKIPWGIFIPHETPENRTLKNLRTREQFDGLSIDDIVQKIRLGTY